jgi:hypothetical protein
MSHTDIPTSTASYLATQYFKTNNPLYDIPLAMIIGVFLTTLAVIIGDFKNTLFGFLRYMIVKSWVFSKELIFGKVNRITIEHVIKNNSPKVNNKLLIDAIRFNFGKGNKYQVENTQIKRKFRNEHDREMGRNLVRKIDEIFCDDLIEIRYEMVMKKINQDMNSDYSRGQKKKKGYEFEEMPYKEIITLKSHKPLEEMEKYIENRRNKYIDEFCQTDLTQSIYPVNEYTQKMLSFHKIPYDSKKTFKTWFSPQKEDILRLITHFKNKTGSYSLPGTQNKLGLLLYGEPGCGKTSLIKALAKELDRSIFPIFLDKFKSLTSLKNIFYNDYVWVTDTGSRGKWEYLPINKRIIVFEEIDTAGTIVMNRNQIRKMIEQKNNREEFMGKYAFFGKILEDFEDQRIKKKRGGLYDSDDYSDDEDKVKIDDTTFSKVTKHESGITIGDLLSIFDGICELNDLVYIVTTNHVDYLDPALIRSGRITKRIKMGKMLEQEIKDMLNYYYVQNNIYNENNGEIDKTKIITNLSKKLDGKIKPSKLEELCNTCKISEIMDIYLSEK